MHRHHLEDAGLLDHLLFLAQHHRQIARVKLSILAHGEREDVVYLRLGQPAQVHGKALEQILHRCGKSEVLEKTKDVRLDPLGTEIVEAHQGDIRFERARDRAEGRDKDDGAVIHLAARDALREVAQTRDDLGILEHSLHILEHEDLARKILLPQHRIKRGTQVGGISDARRYIHVSAVHAPLDEPAPLLHGEFYKNAAHLAMFERVDVEQRQPRIHILLELLAKYRLICHDVPSFLLCISVRPIDHP